MYRIIRFKRGVGKTLARFHTEEEVAAYRCSAQDKTGLSGNDARHMRAMIRKRRSGAVGEFVEVDPRECSLAEARVRQINRTIENRDANPRVTQRLSPELL